MSNLFGTDGVRGLANVELTPQLAFKLGQASASMLAKDKKQPTLIIGMDTRISGDMLENAISAGIMSVGGNVIKLGVIPTPAVAFLTKKFKADAGVVISASHNPFFDNGIKFFNGDGLKLDDDIQNKIEELVLKVDSDIIYSRNENIGRVIELADNGEELYIDFLKSTAQCSFKGLNIVLDCANGASYRVAERVFVELGATVSVIGNDPDGININDNVGSTHPEKLGEVVVRNGADFGLAFDGDADRLIVVDENGNAVHGDKTIAICAKLLKENKELKNDRVTLTVMSNMGVIQYIKDVVGADSDITGVGDRYVLESMLQTGSVLGGEQSGHIIFKNYTTTGDGILAGIQFSKAVIHNKKNVSELEKEIQLYPQVLVNARVDNENKKAAMSDEELVKSIEKIESDLAGEGRVLIRPSGTEPLIRVMIEGKNKEEIQVLAEDLANLLIEKYSK